MRAPVRERSALRVPLRKTSLSLAIPALLLPALAIGADAQAPGPKVSFYHEVRPILQANCQGCHQPAKSKGGYVMTDFKKLLAGGDTEGAAVVPRSPDKSALLKMITPQDGEIRMPKGKSPLLDNEVALLRSWI